MLFLRGESTIPSVATRLWLFNENTTSHRGVWHIPDRPLEYEDVPGSSTLEEHRITLYHNDSSCISIWTGRDYTYECHCPLNTDKPFIKTNDKWFEEIIKPPHRKIIGRYDVLCGQVTIRPHSGIDSGRTSYKGKPGEIKVNRYRIVKPFVWEGDVPPGPYCSRCLAKAERDAE